MTRSGLALTLLLAFATSNAPAQPYPNKPIRLIVPWPPTGTVDILGRTIGQKLSESMGQNVVVDNRGGANGMIGTEMAAKAAPDGYTVVVENLTGQTINAALRDKMPYDIHRDLAHVSLLAWVPNGVVCLPTLPAKTIQELIALAKAQPGKIDYASSGNGSSQHLVGALFVTMTGAKLNHVPYKGSNQAMNDLLGGQVPVSFAGVPNVLPNLASGKLKALAVSTAKRYAELPDVPSLAESGVPGYDATVWLGLLAPPGTPREIVQKLNTEITRILSTPDARKLMASAGVEVATGSPEEFGRLLQSEYDRWGKVVRDTGATVN